MTSPGAKDSAGALWSQHWRSKSAGARVRLIGGLLALAGGVQSGSAADPATQPASPQISATTSEAPATGTSPGVLKKLSLEELMNVEVTTVTRTESTVGLSPAAVFVITPEMIDRSGALSLPELFRMVPGMDVARVNGNTWAVSSRGYSSAFGAVFQNNLLVQVDGRSVYNPIFGGVFWDTVDYPLQDIERIEVVRGPGGTVWGDNAVNGVINIITKPADETQGGLVSGGAGTLDRGFGSIRYGGKIGDNTCYRVYGKGLTRGDDFDFKAEPNDSWTVGDGGFRIDSHPSDANQFTLQGDYVHSDASSFAQAGTRPFDFTSQFTERSNGTDVLGRWTHQVGKDSSWSLQTYWNYVERDSFDNILNLRWSTYDLDFQHNFLIGDNQKFNYGLEYRYNDSFLGPSSSSTLTGVTRARQSVYSGFLQDQIALAPDRLFLTLGSKLEYNTFSRFEYQPSGRLLWSVDPRQSVWAAISRAVHTPDVFERDVRFVEAAVPPAPATTVIAPNMGIDSEAVIAYELGYRVQATETVSLDTAAFYNDYTKISLLVPAGAAPVPFIFKNAMRGKSYGVEVGATWKPADWWQVRSAYTFQTVELHPDPSLSQMLQSTYGQASRETPQNQLYLQSTWNLPHHVDFDLMARYVETTGGFVGPQPNVPSYISMDARLAWKPRDDLELAVVGQNLLDNHHPEFGGSPSVEIRRSVYGTVTYRW